MTGEQRHRQGISAWRGLLSLGLCALLVFAGLAHGAGAASPATDPFLVSVGGEAPDHCPPGEAALSGHACVTAPACAYCADVATAATPANAQPARPLAAATAGYPGIGVRRHFHPPKPTLQI